MRTRFQWRVLGLVCLMAGSGGLALAERADRFKPMNIEADNLRYDDFKQTSVFTGRVVVTKGSIVMRGARIDIREDGQGHHFGVIVAEPGQRAFYRQKREGLDEYTEGEGETIEYDGKSDRVKFIKRAEMRRYRGATLNDEISGNLIVYDNQAEVFSVDGGAAQSGTAALTPSGTPSARGRVRAVLTPKSAEASQPGAPLAPAANLRTSPALTEGRN